MSITNGTTIVSANMFTNTSSTGNLFITNPKITYNVLGTDIEFSGYTDNYLGIMIATLNCLGIEYYIELKKQNIRFSGEIEEFLEKELMTWERNNKIDSIIE